MSEAEWFALRLVLDRLASFLGSGEREQLDALGEAWRVWTRPVALQ